MEHPLPKGHIRLSTRYAYAPLRCGLSLMDLKTGASLYVQPGDDEAVIREVIDALCECAEESIIDHVAHVALGEYF